MSSRGLDLSIAGGTTTRGERGKISEVINIRPAWTIRFDHASLNGISLQTSGIR